METPRRASWRVPCSKLCPPPQKPGDPRGEGGQDKRTDDSFFSLREPGTGKETGRRRRRATKIPHEGDSPTPAAPRGLRMETAPPEKGLEGPRLGVGGLRLTSLAAAAVKSGSGLLQPRRPSGEGGGHGGRSHAAPSVVVVPEVSARFPLASGLLFPQRHSAHSQGHPYHAFRSSCSSVVFF